MTLAAGQDNPVEFGIAVDATSVYWTTSNAVMKVPLSGGTPVTLATPQNYSDPIGIAVDATNVYWGDFINGNVGGGIMTIPTGGGTATPIPASEQGHSFAYGEGYPVAIASDGVNLYWTQTSASTSGAVLIGGVVEWSLDGGTVIGGAIRPVRRNRLRFRKRLLGGN